MKDHLPHLELINIHQEIKYSTNGGGDKPPHQSQQEHGSILLQQYEKAWEDAIRIASSVVLIKDTRNGVYLLFSFDKKFDKYVTKLENRKNRKEKIRLCCIFQHENDDSTAIIFVPKKNRKFISNKIDEYKSSNSEKPPHADLMNSITGIHCPQLENFWSDNIDSLPNDSPEWIELWIAEEYNTTKSHPAEDRSIRLLNHLKISFQQDVLRFPERTVLLIYANRQQLEQLISYSADISEFRFANRSPQEWLESITPLEQSEFVQDMKERISVEIDNNSPVCVCILDSGINRAHPLLDMLLEPEDCQAFNNDWGISDSDREGHGTAMAGLVAYGNLFPLLESTSTIVVNHILESVKILPPHGENPPQLWGVITSQAISLAEIQAPKRKRIICSAVTSCVTEDNGRPSSWSAEIDNIAFARLDEDDNETEAKKRLFLLAAGNVELEGEYPHVQIISPIQDPSQAWNAITVGAYTQLSVMKSPDLVGLPIVAQPNQLSPFSSTSLLWEDHWPIKPEVVFEGGNQVISHNHAVSCYDLSLISTSHDFHKNQLCNFSMTSAATALGANFAAKIQHQYPHFWPETIRALMIHSAEWPIELLRQFCKSNNKSEKYNLMRACGYGVPNLNRALYSASNSLTLIAQSDIQPYINKNYKYTFNNMHYYQLPWPIDALEELGDKTVKMRITLSYFIEPSPGSTGWNNRYRYPSYGLRFHLKRPEESSEEFQQRININTQEENDERPEDTQSHSYRDHWTIGSTLRNRGSIHSDTWTGSATELCNCNEIIITPIGGWWKYRYNLKMGESKTRYSLIISLYTDELEESIDLYTPVQNIVQPVILNSIQ